MTLRNLRILGISGLFAGLLVFGAASASAGLNEREASQRDRIGTGHHDGSLTGRETLRLAGEQARIERKERRFRSDGVLGPRERASLNRDLNRSSRHVYRARHNERTH